MVTCSHCEKVLDREAYCSGACKVAFFRKGKKHDSKKFSAQKVDSKTGPDATVEEIAEEIETVLQLPKKKWRNGCELHGRKECLICKYKLEK